MTPQLTTNRLILRPYMASLVTPQHIGWLNNREVVRYSEQRHRTHTEETQHVYLNEKAKSPHEHIWLIQIKKSPRDIGTITANVDIHNRIADMGILIGEKEVHNMGYGTEAWKKVMSWLFDKPQNMRKIECGCMLDNRAMRRLTFKAGMTIEGVKLQHFFLDKKPHDALYYGRIRK